MSKKEFEGGKYICVVGSLRPSSPLSRLGDGSLV